MNDERIQKLLQSALPPMGDAQLRRDLWPDMRHRLESGAAHSIRFGPIDWAIAAAIAAAILVFPSLIPQLLYQL